MSYEIKVDKAKCIGCGSCEAICPRTFSLKDGKAIAKSPLTQEISCETEAKDSCPVDAITIKKK